MKKLESLCHDDLGCCECLCHVRYAGAACFRPRPASIPMIHVLPMHVLIARVLRPPAGQLTRKRRKLETHVTRRPAGPGSVRPWRLCQTDGDSAGPGNLLVIGFDAKQALTGFGGFLCQLAGTYSSVPRHAISSQRMPFLANTCHFKPFLAIPSQHLFAGT